MSTSSRHLRNEGNTTQAAIAGSLSGLTARCLTAPLDVVKIRLQIQPHGVHTSTSGTHGIWRTIRKLYSQGGAPAFWKGNVSASWLYLVYNMAQFSAYRTLAPVVDRTGIPSGIGSTLSGALAGSVATATSYPFDLVRTRFAAQGSRKVYASFRKSIGAIYRQEGPVGFYRGLSIAICQGAPYMGLLFGVFESIRPLVSSVAPNASSSDAIAGAIASALAKTGTYPLDLIRKRLQIQGPQRLNFADGLVPEYGRGFWCAGKSIMKTEGWRGLYRGLTIALVKSTPTSTISMWAYGIALRLLERGAASTQETTHD